MRGRKRAINVLGEAAARPLKRWKTNSVPSSVFITDTSRIGYWAPRFITNESLTAPRIKAITHWVPESVTKSFPALEIYFNPLASDSNAAEHLPEYLTEWRSAAHSCISWMQKSLEVTVHLYRIEFDLQWAKTIFAYLSHTKTCLNVNALNNKQKWHWVNIKKTVVIVILRKDSAEFDCSFYLCLMK